MDISALRAHLGLTQAELAEAVGCSRASIAMWETRAARPSVDMAWRIIEAAERDGLAMRLEDIFPRRE